MQKTIKTKIYHDDYMNITLWKIDKKYFFMYHEKQYNSQHKILIPIENVTRFIEKFLTGRTNLLSTSVTDNMRAYLHKNNDKRYYLTAFKLVELINETPATLIEPLNFRLSKTFDDADYLSISMCAKYIAEMARKENVYAIQILSFLTTGKNSTTEICPLQIKIIKGWDDDYLDFLIKIAKKNLLKLFKLADEANLIKQR